MSGLEDDPGSGTGALQVPLKEANESSLGMRQQHPHKRHDPSHMSFLKIVNKLHSAKPQTQNIYD